MMMYFGLDILGFIMFGICSASWICRCISFDKFWKTSGVFSSKYLSPQPPLSSSFTFHLDSKDMGIRSFFIVPRVPEFHICIYIYLYLNLYICVVQIGCFYYSIFKFTDSFHCPLHFFVEPIHLVFFIPVLESLFCSISLLRLFIFFMYFK